MYEILMQELFKLSKKLSDDLYQAWMQINLAGLQNKKPPFDTLVPLINDLDLKASYLLDQVAANETSDQARFRSKLHCNLTLCSYLQQVAEQLTQAKVLPELSFFLQNRITLNRFQLRSVSSSDAVLDHIKNEVNSIRQRRNARWFRGYWFWGNFSRDYQRQFCENVNLYFEALEQELHSAPQEWAELIQDEIQCWEAGLSLGNDAKASLKVKEEKPEKAEKAENPAEYKLPSKIEEILNYHERRHKKIQKKQGIRAELLSHLPPELKEKQVPAALWKKLDACIQIRHIQSRFLDKSLLVFHLDQTAFRKLMQEWSQLEGKLALKPSASLSLNSLRL